MPIDMKDDSIHSICLDLGIEIDLSSKLLLIPSVTIFPLDQIYRFSEAAREFDVLVVYETMSIDGHRVKHTYVWEIEKDKSKPMGLKIIRNLLLGSSINVWILKGNGGYSYSSLVFSDKKFVIINKVFSPNYIFKKNVYHGYLNLYSIGTELFNTLYYVSLFYTDMNEEYASSSSRSKKVRTYMLSPREFIYRSLIETTKILGQTLKRSSNEKNYTLTDKLEQFISTHYSKVLIKYGDALLSEKELEKLEDYIRLLSETGDYKFGDKRLYELSSLKHILKEKINYLRNSYNSKLLSKRILIILLQQFLRKAPDPISSIARDKGYQRKLDNIINIFRGMKKCEGIIELIYDSITDIWGVNSIIIDIWILNTIKDASEFYKSLKEKLKNSLNDRKYIGEIKVLNEFDDHVEFGNELNAVCKYDLIVLLVMFDYGKKPLLDKILCINRSSEKCLSKAIERCNKDWLRNIIVLSIPEIVYTHSVKFIEKIMDSKERNIAKAVDVREFDPCTAGFKAYIDIFDLLRLRGYSHA